MATSPIVHLSIDPSMPDNSTTPTTTTTPSLSAIPSSSTTPTTEFSTLEDVNPMALSSVRLNVPPAQMKGAYTHSRALEDTPGIAHALELFLASHMKESEEYCTKSDPKMERLYFASGYGLIQCVKALMSYEDEDLLSAISHTTRGNTVAQQHRKKAASLTSRLAGLVVNSISGNNSNAAFIKSMTTVERHAELIYAETLFEKALLGIVYSGDWLAFIKEALNLRTTVMTYRQLGKFLEQADAEAAAAAAASSSSSPSSPSSSTPIYDTTIDQDFRSGVFLGNGTSNLILSMMPPRLLSIVEMFGFKGDRKEGLGLLMKAGGWTEESDEPGVGAEEEGLRRSICDMTLIIFHLFMSGFTFTGVNIRMAEKILNWNLRRYPNGVFFLFAQGRLRLIRGQPALAIESYEHATRVQSQYDNLHHISYWEIAISNFALWEVGKSLEYWRLLERDATWSKAAYAFGIAVCVLQEVEDEERVREEKRRVSGGEESEEERREWERSKESRLKEAERFFEKVPTLQQRIAGKSIPMEKYVARKARKFKSQGNRLTLPGLEFAYFLSISRAPRSVIVEKMIPAIRAAQEKLGVSVVGAEGKGMGMGDLKEKEKRYYGNGVGFWDDFCLAYFLEGVCMMFVAYPEPDVAPVEFIPPSPEFEKEAAAKRALAAFELVFEHGTKITLDHHLVYHAHYEIGRLYSRMGREENARKHLNLVLSGKPLEVNTSTRKGKYSLENALHMRTNAAIEALDAHRSV